MSEEQLTPATAEPPKAALPKPTMVRGTTLKLKPVLRKPAPGGSAGALRPGLKLPAQGGVRPGLKLPTQTAVRPDASPAAPAPAAPSAPMEQLKTVTQKLKGVTQQIPQQAILHKTGIIAVQDVSEAQKQAAKSRTARISLSDAIGVAPVNNEAAPMKTIRIKRPVDIANKPAAPAPAPAPAPAAPASAAETAADPKADTPQTTVTQRKTLKISRPGSAVRPAGKFGIKKPSAPAAGATGAADANDVADIPDIPDMPTSAAPRFTAPAADPDAIPDVSKGVAVSGVIFQLAACIVMGLLGYYLYNDMQLPMFCGGCQ